MSSIARLCIVGEVIELKEDLAAIFGGKSGTLFDQVSLQTINSALGKILATLLACVFVAVAIVLEFLPAFKELEDELIGSATHRFVGTDADCRL